MCRKKIVFALYQTSSEVQTVEYLTKIYSVDNVIVTLLKLQIKTLLHLILQTYKVNTFANATKISAVNYLPWFKPPKQIAHIG